MTPRRTGGRVRLSGFVARPCHGRPLALNRCIGNLLDNALRYGGRADIQAKDSDEVITLSVADRGTGLGLGIARNIARAHGGDLVLKNRDGGGLVAELSLPR